MEVRAPEPPLKQQNKAQHSTVAARHLSANDSTPVQNSSGSQVLNNNNQRRNR
jgi:hypothetical protein